MDDEQQDYDDASWAQQEQMQARSLEDIADELKRAEKRDAQWMREQVKQAAERYQRRWGIRA